MRMGPETNMNRGFTITEILVAIAVMTVLAGARVGDLPAK